MKVWKNGQKCKFTSDSTFDTGEKKKRIRMTLSRAMSVSPLNIFQTRELSSTRAEVHKNFNRKVNARKYGKIDKGANPP